MSGFKRKRSAKEEDDIETLIMNNNNFKIVAVNNKIYFNEDINVHTILELTKMLKTIELELLQTKQELDLEEIPKIFLYIHSNGGDAYAGFSIMNTLENMKVPIVTIVNGLVASAATLMLLGGTERHMLKNSNILIHQIRGGVWGKYDDLQDELKNSAQMMKDLEKLYTSKTSIPLTFLKRIIKRELNLTPDMCLEYGIVDKII